MTPLNCRTSVNGTSLLSGMESAISGHAGNKAAALADLARWSWLDSTFVDSAITRLKTFHDSLPAENEARVVVGWYMAKDQPAALQAVAEQHEGDSLTSELFTLWKRYAQAEEAEGWLMPDSGTVVWLESLAQDRWTLGSAQASAWLQALGRLPLEEVISLPVEQKSRQLRRERRRASETAVMQAWPNPSTGPVFVLCNVPPGVSEASLRILDLNGRLIQERALASGTGLVELDPQFATAGIYLAELRLDGIRAGQMKLVLQ